MTNTAAAQLRRILHLVPRLADGEEHSLDSIAEMLGVDVATVRKDLHSLVERYQQPGGFVEAVQVYLETDRVSLMSNHFLRPMRLTSQELCALELGLAMLATERHDERPTIDGARERLRALITKLPPTASPGDLYHASLGATVDHAHLAAVRRALRNRQKLYLTYHGSASTTAETRVIAPYAMIATRGMFYVVAYCERSEGLRIFRLDRVEGAEVMPARFEVPATFSLDEVLREGRAFQSRPTETLRIRYSPRVARWIAERERVPLDGDGSVTIAHPLADPAWAVRHVLQYGPEAEVVEPADVREKVRQRLAGMAAAVAQD